MINFNTENSLSHPQETKSNLGIHKNSKKIQKNFNKKSKELEACLNKKEATSSLKTKLKAMRLRKEIKRKREEAIEYSKPEYQYPPAHQVLSQVQLDQLHVNTVVGHDNPQGMTQLNNDTCAMFFNCKL